VSTAATVATSDDGVLTNSNDSDTYEPIETFQDLFVRPKTVDEPSRNCEESKKQVCKLIIDKLLFQWSNLALNS
jgi:hypothetical protein